MTKKQLLLLIQILKIKIQIIIFRKKLTVPTLSGPKHIVLHHGAGRLNFEQVDTYHRRKWGFKSTLGYYIGYHYFIENGLDNDGAIYQGRVDTEEGAHTVGDIPRYWNKNSVGICLQGNFETQMPTKAQVDALKGLLVRLMGKYGIDKSEIYGHRNKQATLCPGRNLYKLLEDYKK